LRQAFSTDSKIGDFHSLKNGADEKILDVRSGKPDRGMQRKYGMEKQVKDRDKGFPVFLGNVNGRQRNRQNGGMDKKGVPLSMRDAS